jgi:hypothetical protein
VPVSLQGAIQLLIQGNCDAFHHFTMMHIYHEVKKRRQIGEPQPSRRLPPQRHHQGLSHPERSFRNANIKGLPHWERGDFA